MIAFITLVLIAFGYHYASTNPTQKAMLKRSAGWETYGILLKHGFYFGFWGFLVAISIILLVSFLIALIVAIGEGTFVEAFKSLMSLLFDTYFGIKHFIIVCTTLLFSYFICVGSITNSSKNLNELKQLDSFLDVLLTAMEQQTAVKISLKSRKVYIGAVYQEQFEQLNFDNIVIIPYLSGYRDKDTLKLKLHCNYMEIYSEYDIQELTDESATWSLSDFRLTIKASEVESISLFYESMFRDFQAQDAKQEQSEIQAEN